jgi:hypothetical protein
MFITATALAVAIAAFAPPAVQHAVAAAHDPVVTEASLDRAEFHDAMRKLWEDHVTWTRLYIVTAVAGLPDVQATAERLLQNQTDIGNAIKPYYGAAAGSALTGLLRQHILIAADLIAAAKAGDQAKVATEQARWRSNADEIASFLSKANPQHWQRGDLRAMLNEHLRLTTQEVVARLQGKWAADVAAYDRIHHHALGMADALSSGIVDQFPKRFR